MRFISEPMRNQKLKTLAATWALGGLLAATALFTGCQTSETQNFSDLSGMRPAATPAPAGAPGAGTTAAQPTNTVPGAPVGQLDQLHVGDTLQVSFADLPGTQLPMEERIRDDGTITLLLNQTFKASGKTRGELEREIRERYVPRYYVNMTVSIKPLINTQFYFVGGEVKMPNRQVYISRITVLKAIQSAGDFTDFAKKTKVRLTRANGKVEIINCIKAQDNPKLDPEVFPGDKIWVPRRIF